MKKLSLISLFFILFTSCRDDESVNQKQNNFAGKHLIHGLYKTSDIKCNYIVEDSFDVEYEISRNGTNGLKIPNINNHGLISNYDYVEVNQSSDTASNQIIVITNSNLSYYNIIRFKDSILIYNSYGRNGCHNPTDIIESTGKKIN